MRVCSKNHRHRRLGQIRCEVPGCGALVIETADAKPQEPDRDPSVDETEAEHSQPATDEPGTASQQAGEDQRDPKAFAPEPRAQLNWPWGQSRLAETLRIGRDSNFSPLASALAVYDDISRRHAEIGLQGPQLVLRDLGSTNGTYVNGKRIPPGQAITVEDGATLRFGTKLSVRVDIAGA